MIKVVISGYGRMGHMVEAALAAKGIECVAASEDIASFDKDIAKDCVCIDFTFPQSFRANYKVLADNFKAVVVGTTGWEDIREEVIGYFHQKGTTMIYASNFSIGVNALFAAVSRASSILKGHGYEPHIEETHHIHKLDAPSGTAKSLATLVKDSLDDEVQITSKREGEVAGIHTLTLTSAVDKLTFTHEAFSREGFAVGAVYAAMLTEEIRGVHEFKELIL